MSTTRKLLRHLSGDDYILEFDWTSIESFTTCDRSAEWKLVHSRIAPPGGALTYGAAIHSGLEEWYRRHSPLDTIYATMEPHFVAHPPSGDEWRNFPKACDTLKQYVAKYPEEPFTLLTHEGQPIIERPFKLPLGTLEVDTGIAFPKHLLVYNCEDTSVRWNVNQVHVLWTGVMDLAFEQTGNRWVCDHKTSSIIGDSFWKSFELSQQMLGYVWSAQQLFQEPFQGAMVNCLAGRKPTKTGVALDLVRRYFPYPQDLVDEWRTNMLHIVSQFLDNLVSGHFPMKSQWCVSKYGTCPYHDVCNVHATMGEKTLDELRHTVLYSARYTDNTWDPTQA